MLINCSVRGASRKSKAEQWAIYGGNTARHWRFYPIRFNIIREYLQNSQKKKKEEKEETKM
jgi:hypothetical protein